MPIRILVVDDNRDAADSLAAVLQLWGHEVFVANDGSTAIELARAHRPRVAVLDLAMPRMDGCELARRLQRETEGIFLIANSGYSAEHFPESDSIFHLIYLKGSELLGLQLALQRLSLPDGTQD